MSIADLVECNSLANPDLIVAGDSFCICNGEAEAIEAPTISDLERPIEVLVNLR